MTRTLWTTRGARSGSCGHEHKTMREAFDCCSAEWEAAEQRLVRSDRDVRPIGRELTHAECIALDAMISAHAKKQWIVMCVPGRSDADASSYFAFDTETRRSVSARSREDAERICKTRNTSTKGNGN
jgi:hypothetical protein